MSRVWPRVRRVFGPVAGFGIGWAAFAIADERDWLDARVRRWLLCSNLKLQLRLQRVMPRALTDAYGVPEEVLCDAIARLERSGGSSNDGDDDESGSDTRVTFGQLLSECSVVDQLHFLEEHALEEIPYFYIADLFDAWATLHTQPGCVVRTDAATSSSTIAHKQPLPSSSSSSSNSNASACFDAPVLCEALWRKLLGGVVPYDVSVRALCVLATRSQRNAALLAKHIDAAVLLDRYAAYRDARTHAKACDKDEDGDDEGAASAAAVAAATLTLLRALNDAHVRQQQHSRLVRALVAPLRVCGVLGGSVDVLPLARRVTAEQWCNAFAQPQPSPPSTQSSAASGEQASDKDTSMGSHGSDDACVLTAEVRAWTVDAVVPFANAMHTRLRCAERQPHVQL